MDSTIADPYQKWIVYDQRTTQIDAGVNYADGKTKTVAWYVDQCQSNNNRMDYARELQKYIQVGEKFNKSTIILFIIFLMLALPFRSIFTVHVVISNAQTMIRWNATKSLIKIINLYWHLKIQIVVISSQTNSMII